MISRVQVLREKLSSLESLQQTEQQQAEQQAVQAPKGRAPLAAVSGNIDGGSTHGKKEATKAQGAPVSEDQQMAFLESRRKAFLESRRPAFEVDEIALSRCRALEQRKANEVSALLSEYRRLKARGGLSQMKVWPAAGSDQTSWPPCSEQVGQ